nr:uncharacterized protein LOC123288848 [Equus asinus]
MVGEGLWSSLLPLGPLPSPQGALCDRATDLSWGPGVIVSGPLPELSCLRAALHFRHGESSLVSEKHSCHLAELHFHFLGNGYHPRLLVWTGALPRAAALPPLESILTTPVKRRNVRKPQVEPRGRNSRSPKKSAALQAYRQGLKALAEACGLTSLLQSDTGRLPSNGAFHRLSCPHSPGDVWKPVSAGAQQPCVEPKEDFVHTRSPALSPATLTEHLLPVLASTAPPLSLL